MSEFNLRNKHHNQFIQSQFKNRHRRSRNRNKRRCTKTKSKKQCNSMDKFLKVNDIHTNYDIVYQKSDSINDTNTQIQIWKCSHCTYINTNSTHCSICQLPYPSKSHNKNSNSSFPIASYINESTQANKFLQKNTKKMKNKRKKFKKDNHSFNLFNDSYNKYKKFMQKRKTSIIANKTAPNQSDQSIKKKLKGAFSNIPTALIRQFSWKKMNPPSENVAKKAVNATEKQQAKNNNASTCYGEILEQGVTKLLNNLQASHPNTKNFYDLGMGSGKLVIQTYLQCDNLRKCVGIEVTKSRYILAECILQQLLNKGYLSRRFLCVECQKGEYFKIVEVNHMEKKIKWKIADYCIAYNPSLRKSKKEIINYHGMIVGKGNNKYTILYDNGTKGHNIPYKYLFVPNTDRVLEIWNGSCFDYPNGICDADIAIMAIRFLSNMYRASVRIMYAAPIGCKFLTYELISKFDGFDGKRLKGIDCSDRYETSWCNAMRFYLWELIK